MAKRQQSAARNGRNGNGHAVAEAAAAPRGRAAVEEVGEDRLPVLKTYKIYVGGKFPRTESGRYYVLKDGKGRPLANVCRCSRKDFRDAVGAARSAQGSWAGRAAYNRSQILYRIAEMLEGRTAQFVDELVQQGATPGAAKKEVAVCVDRLVYYAGWADKYQQVFSSVNPVASSHFNFSVLEPTGVVAALCPEDTGLLGLVSTITPAITGGNTVIALAATNKPLCAVTLGEVLATSDLPGGVVNILTGDRGELLDPFSNHMDVNAVVYCGNDLKEIGKVRTNAANNVKRAIVWDRRDWAGEQGQGPYFVLDTQEVKTTWHPVGV